MELIWTILNVLCLDVLTHQTGIYGGFMGYKNAHHIEPKLGDEVECGLPGNTSIVASFAEYNPTFRNVSFDGKLCLNDPSNAVLVKSVDGFVPRDVECGVRLQQTVVAEHEDQ